LSRASAGTYKRLSSCHHAGGRHDPVAIVRGLPMFGSRDGKREPPPWMKPRAVEQPESGHHRIACGESCKVTRDGRTREGMIWNLSVLGVYLVMEAPLPTLGETVMLTFNL